MKKIITIIIIVLLIIFSVYLIKNFFIIRDIYKNNAEFMNFTGDNYYFEKVSTSKLLSNDKFTEKLYVKNGTYKYNYYENDELVYTHYWNNDLNKDLYAYVNEDEGYKKTPQETINSMYSIILPLTYNEENNQILEFGKVIKNIFIPIKIEDNFYIISKDNVKYYFDKDTGLLQKFETSETKIEVKFDKDIVTDIDIEEPNKEN